MAFTDPFPPGISVIICCYNSANRLQPTLQHLADQEIDQAVSWEIILVDNASTDDTAPVATAFWQGMRKDVPLRIIPELRPGTDHARRTGIYASRYRYFVFCDDDNWLMPDYLQTGFQYLQQHPRVGLVGGRSEAIADMPFPAWFEAVKGYYAVGAPAQVETELTLYGIWGAGMMGRTVAMQQALPQDIPLLNAGRVGTNAGFGEDGEMCMRVAMLGYKIMFTPELLLQHFMASGRLTTQYRDKLLDGAREPAAVMASYFRLLHWNKQKTTVRWLFATRHALQWFFQSKIMRMKDGLQFSIDFCYYAFNSKRWETDQNSRIKAFYKLIQSHSNT